MDKFIKISDKIIEYSKENDYAGYSKHDALNSKLLNTLSFNNKYLSLIFIQAIMRFPINLRPLFLVEKSRNPKGIALFIRGLLNLYSQTGKEVYKDESIKLLDWLIDNHSNKENKFSGICYGYNFIWQSPFFRAEKYYPNQTVSTFCGEAFIKAYRVLNEKKYLEYALSVSEYLIKDLPVLYEDDSKKCIGYIQGIVTEQVININSMAAAFLSKLYKEMGEEKYKTESIKLINFVLENITDDYAWYYTTNKKKSYIDNYHTGGIIEQIYESMVELGHYEWQEILLKSAENYKTGLFTENYAPKYRSNREYPYDIHGSAQGIITFSKLSEINNDYIKTAENILNWTIKNLYSDKGYFYYQKYKYYTKKFTLMRWCQSWMLYAISEFIINKKIF